MPGCSSLPCLAPGSPTPLLKEMQHIPDPQPQLILSQHQGRSAYANRLCLDVPASTAQAPPHDEGSCTHEPAPHFKAMIQLCSWTVSSLCSQCSWSRNASARDVTCVKFARRMLGNESVDGAGRAKPGFARPKKVPVGVRLLPTCFVRSAASCPPSTDADCHCTLIREADPRETVPTFVFDRRSLPAALLKAVSMDACSNGLPSGP